MDVDLERTSPAVLHNVGTVEKRYSLESPVGPVAGASKLTSGPVRGLKRSRNDLNDRRLPFAVVHLSGAILVCLRCR